MCAAGTASICPRRGVAVLDQGEPERNRRVRQGEFSRLRDQFVEDREALAVESVRALLFAQPDRDHLHQAALDLAAEVRVRFDAVDRDDRVGFLVGVAIDVDRHARSHLAELHRLHPGPDLAADRLFGDAQRGQDVDLALGRGSAVAAHCRDDEDFRPGGAEPCDGRANDLVDAVDAAAAGRDANPTARRNRTRHRSERRGDGCGDVAHFGRFQALPHQRPAGQWASHELVECPARRDHRAHRRVAQLRLAE